MRAESMLNELSNGQFWPYLYIENIPWGYCHAIKGEQLPGSAKGREAQLSDAFSSKPRTNVCKPE
ncbi:hypothetical protein GALL_436960 [mine drainage metagenome]|uniref:Uncharacterized protein n=1 Tax=mine drainage metagenome TaxID=410659 RepID=A0A1J5PU43_9ZZZZ